MTYEDGAERARLERTIRDLEVKEFQARTTATGLAKAPRLASAAVDGMWFFLGVQVDPVGLRPQPVRILDVQGYEGRTYVLIAEDSRRLLIASKQGLDKIHDGLGRLEIEVVWNEEVGGGR